MHMAKHYGAFLASAAMVGFAYQKRDSAPSLDDILGNQEKILTTFEEFKEKNDARLKDMERRGAEDPVAREQVEKIKQELMALKEIREELDKLAKKAARPGGSAIKQDDFTPEQIEHRSAFERFLRDPTDEQVRMELQQIQRKAVDTTTDAAGGYAVPEIISRRIEKELLEISSLRGLVDVQTAGSKDYKILVDVNGTAYGWVGETDPRPETGTSGLEEVAPTFGMIYAYPKASEESLDDIFFNVEDWIVNSALEAFDAGEENAVINGNGVKKPTGFLNGTPTLQDDGTRAFGTLQYLATGVAASFAASNPVDTFIRTIYKLKKGYRRNARWLMNKKTAGDVMLFKDGDGNYLWQPSSILGQPDMLKGYPVAESEEMPDVAANAFPVAFGDFKSGYVLVPLVGLRLTKDEVTTPGYVKWYVRRRLGGNIKKSEAIKLIKCEA